jgi:hypothetical protein
LHRACTCVLVADVDHARQRLAAGGLDLVGCGVDRAGQLGVRLGGLGGDDDVGAVARRAQRDGQADAAAGAGDEEASCHRGDLGHHHVAVGQDRQLAHRVERHVALALVLALQHVDELELVRRADLLESPDGAEAARENGWW